MYSALYHFKYSDVRGVLYVFFLWVYRSCILPSSYHRKAAWVSSEFASKGEERMNVINILMSAGTGLLFISSIPQIRTAWRNKDTLKDYSFWGSLLILVAQICFNTAFFLMNNYVSIAFNLTTLFFWAFVSYYSFRGLSGKVKK